MCRSAYDNAIELDPIDDRDDDNTSDDMDDSSDAMDDSSDAMEDDSSDAMEDGYETDDSVRTIADVSPWASINTDVPEDRGSSSKC